MGGKSRKTGSISKKLIDRIKNSNPNSAKKDKKSGKNTDIKDLPLFEDD